MTKDIERLLDSLLAEPLDEIDWTWLESNYPRMAERIQMAVDEGATPGDIRRYVLRRNGRYEFSKRCSQAARHLVSE
jgi:hypothetical protein